MTSIRYVVVTNKNFKPNDYTNQWNGLSSIINKDYLCNFIYLYRTDNYYYIKSNISSNTGLPIETLIEIGDLSGGDSYYIYNNISDYNDISGHFDEMIKYGGLYILVDIYNSPNFQKKNNAILGNEMKIKKLEQENINNQNQISNLINQNSNLEKQRKREKNELENSIQSLRNQYNNLKYENQSKINELMNQNTNLQNQRKREKNELEKNIQSLRNQYNNLKYENQSKIRELINQNKNLKKKQEEEKNEFQKNINLIKNENINLKNQCDNLRIESQTNKNQITDLQKKQKEEENKKLEEQKKFDNFKITFEKDKQDIENKNIKESKNKITEFIINDYVKPFLNEGDDKSQFKNSLKENMTKFIEDFLNIYCQNFNQSFKLNSKKIAEEYDAKNNKFLINHINFIVIGKAGTGKSTLINSSLLLPENKKAKEGDGMSITEKSTLYNSEKLQMIRMWDTQGLDYEITLDKILDEVKRLVNDGLDNGPDHYINIILYCTTGNRFQKEDGELIHKIMKLYPMDNLPVIITQLQVYFKSDQQKMEKIIRKILKEHLESNIVEKIPIKTVISKDKIEENTIFKAKGIPELLKCSFELTGRAITSATFKKFSEDINNLCKEYVDKKINFIKQKFINEMEILEVAKSMFKNKEEKFFKKDNKNQKVLSKSNLYSKRTDKDFFFKNFIKIMKSKIIDIYNNLNGTNISSENEDECIVIYIQKKLTAIMDKLNKMSKSIFEVKYKKLFNEYLSDLTLKQSSRNYEFKTKNDIINASEINNSFKDGLFQYFQNEFFKYFFCVILYLFMNILKDKILKNYNEEILENKEIQKVINTKAEDSLKSVTKRLKEKLLIELDKYFPEKEEIKKNDVNNEIIDFNFNF